MTIRVHARAQVRAAAALLAMAALAAPVAAQERVVRVGTVRSLATLSNYVAIEKGWWKELGIRVEIEDLDTSANVISLLATNRLQVVEGGVSAGLFNGLEQNMPIVVAGDRISTPLHHKLLVREDLRGKVARLADLKGLNVGTNGLAAVTTYELGRMMESDGGALKDIELKTVAFPLMGAAFKNRAIDATLVIQPWATQMVDQKLAFVLADPDDHVKPRPLTIAVTMFNTDWAKADPKLARDFFVGYMRGVREYCLGYHGGPQRAELVEIGLKAMKGSPRAFFEDYPWPARNMDGTPNMPSILDMQTYFKGENMVKAEQPAEKIFTREYIEHAAKALGPKPAVNAQSDKPGCR